MGVAFVCRAYVRRSKGVFAAGFMLRGMVFFRRAHHIRRIVARLCFDVSRAAENACNRAGSEHNFAQLLFCGEIFFDFFAVFIHRRNDYASNNFFDLFLHFRRGQPGHVRLAANAPAGKVVFRNSFK